MTRKKCNEPAPEIVGMPLADAIKALTAAGRTSHIVEQDGVMFFGSADVNPDRARLRVKRGKVVAVSYG